MRLFLLFSLVCLCLPGFTACNRTPESPITIDSIWIREAPPNATAMAGYMRITNHSDENIILHTAASPEFSSIEFHRSVETNGVYRMTPHLHLHIDANSTFELKPGDYHIMLFNPIKPLRDGDFVSMTFTFSGDQQIEALVPVERAQF